MPGQDKTGPNGQGPMTGRGLGPCGTELVDLEKNHLRLIPALFEGMH